MAIAQVMNSTLAFAGHPRPISPFRAQGPLWHPCRGDLNMGCFGDQKYLKITINVLMLMLMLMLIN